VTALDPFAMARSIAPHGELRRHLPLDEPWRASIGSEILMVLLTKREPTPKQLFRLADTWREAVERQAEAADPCATAMLYTRNRRARCWYRCAIALHEARAARTVGSA
jgi:hypothetical protein